MEKHPLPPSLTGEELERIEVWERTHQSKVVRRLLAEVYRLQAIALRADQLDQCLRETGKSFEFNSVHLVISALRRELDELPLIKERAAAVDFVLNGQAYRITGIRQSGRTREDKVQRDGQCFGTGRPDGNVLGTAQRFAILDYLPRIKSSS